MSAAIHSIPHCGYLYVATVRHEYYIAAKRSAKSLLDFYPEAKDYSFHFTRMGRGRRSRNL